MGSRQADWQDKAIADGRCPRCGGEWHGPTRNCGDCLRVIRERRAAARKAEGKEQLRCSTCDEPGHNARSCES